MPPVMASISAMVPPMPTMLPTAALVAACTSEMCRVISPVAAAAISCFLNLVSTMKLIPGDLGIREFVFAGVSGLFGVGVNEGLHAAALHRIVETLLTLILAPGAMVPLSMKAKEAE